MISWMQKHRKYLVITIWISTIAFVGAGFVGWGSFDYGSMSGDVAKVGKVKVSKEDYSALYGNMYNYYSKVTGGKLDEATLKQLNLENTVLQTLINQALLQNFAEENEMRVSDEEVAAKIASMEPFQKNGKFDKEQYIMALKNAGLAVADFERGLKKELLIEKAASMLAPRVSKNETAALAGSILSSDRIGVKILNGESFIKDVSEAEVKAFWEKNKKNFKTEPSFDLEVIDVASIAIAVSDEDIKKEYAENGSLYHKDGKKMSFEEAKEFVAKNAKIKAAKKEALKKYVDLKDAKVKGRAMNDVKLSTTPMPSQVASELVKTAKPTTLKPIQVGESFFVVKVSKVVPSKEMDFAEASKVAKIALQRENASALMKAEGEKLLKSGFEAKDVGFISKNGKNVISGLNEMESMEVAGNVFRSKNIQDSVTLGSKIVLYKVLEQKISDTNGTINDEMVYNKALLNIKAALVNQNVLEYLKSKYEMKLYIKPDSFTKSTKE